MSRNPDTKPTARGGRKRRRHPAQSARVLTVGISASAVLALTAVMGAQAARTASSAVATTANIGTAQPATGRTAPTASSAPPDPSRSMPTIVIEHRRVVVNPDGTVVKTTRAGKSTPGGSGKAGKSPTASSHRRVPSATPTKKKTKKPPAPKKTSPPSSSGSSGSGGSNSGGSGSGGGTTDTPAPTPAPSHGNTGGSR